MLKTDLEEKDEYLYILIIVLIKKIILKIILLNKIGL